MDLNTYLHASSGFPDTTTTSDTTWTSCALGRHPCLFTGSTPLFLLKPTSPLLLVQLRRLSYYMNESYQHVKARASSLGLAHRHLDGIMQN